MESIALVAAGWASGLNAYLTLLILGVAGRAGWAETPHDLQQTWVLAAAGVAFVIEFVIDKVPILDSLWDLGHTFIRPVVGGLTGAAIAGAQLGRPAAFALAAGLALPLLAMFGYSPGARDASALGALTLAYCLLPCLLKLAAATLLYQHNQHMRASGEPA